MDANRDRYTESKDIFTGLIQRLIHDISEFDPIISDVGVKECILRLNRDIRFSHDKTPYKTSFAAVIAAEGGKKSTLPCYYISISPNETFVAGGLYLPAGDNLKKVRQEIDYNGDNFINILNAPAFKDKFGDIEGERLKTAPRGYDIDNPHISLLRLKSFIVRHNLPDYKVVKDSFYNEALGLFKGMKPFNDFLRIALD